MRIQRIYQTPLRDGFVVLYQNQNENVLRFSKNRLECNSILDYDILCKDFTFRIECDETIVTAIWQQIQAASKEYVCAVVCLNKIYFISDQLKILRKVQIQAQIETNIITQAKWMGPILFYATNTHLSYATLEGEYWTVLSFDNFENKNLISMVLLDRILILTKYNQGARRRPLPGQQQQQQLSPALSIDFKLKSFNILEPLAVSYMSGCRYLQQKPDSEVLKQIIVTYLSNNISFHVVQKLKLWGEFSLAQYILDNEDYRQFTVSQKIGLIKSRLQTTNLLDVLFPMKNMAQKENQAEVTKFLHCDPRFQDTRAILADLQQYLLLLGEYRQAFEVSRLLNDELRFALLARYLQNNEAYASIVTSWLKSRENSVPAELTHVLGNAPLSSDFKQLVEKFLLYETKSDIKNVLAQGAGLKPLSDRLEECVPSNAISQRIDSLRQHPPIQKQQLGFGERLFNQVHSCPPEEEGATAPVLKKIDLLVLDNVHQYLGLSSQFREVKGGQGQMNDPHLQPDENGGMNQNMGLDDEEQEYQDILVYWRCDEGKGLALEDLSNYANGAQIVPLSEKGIDEAALWAPIDDGDPIELEGTLRARVLTFRFALALLCLLARLPARASA